MCKTYYVGWDVGAWECPNTKFAARSQDCITILDEDGKLLFAWMGNIYCPPKNNNGDTKLKDETKTPFKLTPLINSLIGDENNIIHKSNYFSKIDEKDILFIAIDAILGLPNLATSLFNLNENEKNTDNVEDITKKYLFRLTERNLPKHKSPLSVLKDMLGSQATKALFTLRYWNFKWNAQEFVWKMGNHIALETYPSAAYDNVIHMNDKMEIEWNNVINANDEPPKIQLNPAKDIKSRWLDLNDSIICAKVAQKYKIYLAPLGAIDDPLRAPSDNEKAIAGQEGWIWLPESSWKQKADNN